MRRACPIALGWCVALWTGVLAAQEPVLRVDAATRSTVVLGGATDLEVALEDPPLGAAQPPRFEAPAPVDGLRFEIRGPVSSTRTAIVNGRASRQSSVVWTLRVHPSREGAFRFGPLRVFDGNQWLERGPYELEVVKDLKGAATGFLEMSELPQRVYVKEPFDVAVQFGIQGGLDIARAVSPQTRERHLMTYLQAPWLDGVEGVQAQRGPALAESAPIGVNGILEGVAYDQVARQGRDYHRFTVSRRLVPTAPGTLELAAPVLSYTVRTGARRDRFGGLIPGAEETLYLYGSARTIEVMPLPEAGRPSGFLGGVGRFALRGELDRSRVRVGESVKFTLTIEGAGNLEYLDFPERVEAAGFHHLGRTEPVRERDRASATYDLRVVDPAVRAVPPVAYSWFDTGREAYRTDATPELPIAVLAGAARDVLSDPEQPVVAREGAADIADIRELVDSLPATAGRDPGPGWAWAACLLPWLLAGAWAFCRRWRAQRHADPDARRARRAERTFRAELSEHGDAGVALVAYLAARLGCPDAAVVAPDLASRLAARGVDDAVARDAQRLVDSMSAGRYGGTARVDAATASALVAQLERTAWRPAARAPGAEAGRATGARATGGRGTVARGTGGLLAVALGLLASCAEVESDREARVETAAAAQQAFRAGDHARARDLYASLAQRNPGDGLAWFNLGNAHYRLGELPRALWAYENARRALPRDAELLENLRIVRRELALGDGVESFGEAVAALRGAFTSWEWLAGTVALQLLAAGCLVVGWRRRRLRVAGWVLLVPAVLLLLESLWWGPRRPPMGIALVDAAVYAEPTDSLEPVRHLRPGADLQLLTTGEGVGEWRRVRVGGRRGYVRSAAVAAVGN